MSTKFRKNNNRNQDGFTILVAVVTASILLIIAMSIGGIALKEQILSASGKESQVAFFAADTGMECVLYWDQQQGVFVPDVNGNAPSTFIQTPICNGAAVQESNAVAVHIGQNSNDWAEYTYNLKLRNINAGSGATACAEMTITKDTNDPSYNNDDTNPNHLNPPPPSVLSEIARTHTIINSYGYNTCTASLDRVERGILANY